MILCNDLHISTPHCLAFSATPLPSSSTRRTATSSRSGPLLAREEEPGQQRDMWAGCVVKNLLLAYFSQRPDG